MNAFTQNQNGDPTEDCCAYVASHTWIAIAASTIPATGSTALIRALR